MSSAGVQKRYLTQPTSKLAKSNITTLLRKDDAWALLPEETRTHLYSLLPPPAEGEAPHDPNVHPLNTSYKPYIEEELRRWQEDLKEGREQKKWREEAMQAARDRLAGKFDEGVGLMREEYWGASAAASNGMEKEGDDEQSRDLEKAEDHDEQDYSVEKIKMDPNLVERVVKASDEDEKETGNVESEASKNNVIRKAEADAQVEQNNDVSKVVTTSSEAQV